MTGRVAVVVTLLVLLAVLPSAATGVTQAGEQFPAGDVVAHLVFNGSGTATGEQSAGGGSFSETDHYVWHMVYDIDTTALKGWKSGTTSGWETISGAQWNAKQSTFTGTIDRNCTAPSGGTCQVGPGPAGAVTSCEATFGNDPGLPAADFLPSGKGSVKSGTLSVALTAHEGSVITNPGKCAGTGPALDNTCDTYNTRYGVPPSGAVIADFSLNLANPQDTGSVPVSADHSASCGGTSYHTQWTGRISTGGQGCSSRYLASSNDATSADLAPLEIDVNKQDKTKKSVELVVGQQVTVAVACQGKPLKKIQWTFPTEMTFDGVKPAVVSGYTADQGATSANVAPFDGKASATKQSFTLFFMSPGSFKLDVTADGQQSWTQLNVFSPSVKADDALTCVKGVRNGGVDANNTVIFQLDSGATVKPPTFGLGFNDTCGMRYGIAWQFYVQTSKYSGKVGMTQLISRHVEWDKRSCKPTFANAADNSTFYNNQIVDAGPTTVGSWAGHDAPFVPLKVSGGTITATFSADDYVMFRPSFTDAIWVPLATMHWGWQGSVSFLGVPRFPWKFDSGGIQNWSSFAEPSAWPQWGATQPTDVALDCPAG
jgi:hypothetical protein